MCHIEKGIIPCIIFIERIMEDVITRLSNFTAYWPLYGFILVVATTGFNNKKRQTHFVNENITQMVKFETIPPDATIPSPVLIRFPSGHWDHLHYGRTATSLRERIRIEERRHFHYIPTFSSCTACLSYWIEYRHFILFQISFTYNTTGPRHVVEVCLQFSLAYL